MQHDLMAGEESYFRRKKNSYSLNRNISVKIFFNRRCIEMKVE